MWHLWNSKRRKHGSSDQGPVEANFGPMKFVAECESLSRAARRVLEIEGSANTNLLVTATVHTDFPDDEDAITQYHTHTFGARYVMLRRDPLPPQTRVWQLWSKKRLVPHRYGELDTPDMFGPVSLRGEFSSISRAAKGLLDLEQARETIILPLSTGVYIDFLDDVDASDVYTTHARETTYHICPSYPVPKHDRPG